MNSFSTGGKRARIFSSDRLIDSELLNRLGIQIFRILAARLLYNVREVTVDQEVRDRVDELLSEGILVWSNFLPAEEFAALQEEILGIVAERDERLTTKVYGSTISETRSLGSFPPILIPQTHKFLADRRLHEVLEGVEKRTLDGPGKHSIQLLKYEPGNHLADTQTRLHSDTWFNTHKLWFYLNDVKSEDAPFVYVKRSHRLSLAQLSCVYKSSRYDSSSDSRLISSEEIARQGLKETIVTCPKNTLVIANTCGYHRRLSGEPGGRRLSLHSVLRANPFAAYSLRARLSRYPRLHEAIRSAKRNLAGR
jgi:hypothetical protein